MLTADNKAPIKYILADEDAAKVSIVGAGLMDQLDAAARMFSTLGQAGINIKMISTSEIRISCVVSDPDAERAVRIVHDLFHLNEKESRDHLRVAGLHAFEFAKVAWTRSQDQASYLGVGARDSCSRVEASFSLSNSRMRNKTARRELMVERPAQVAADAISIRMN